MASLPRYVGPQEVLDGARALYVVMRLAVRLVLWLLWPLFPVAVAKGLRCLVIGVVTESVLGHGDESVPLGRRSVNAERREEHTARKGNRITA